MANYYYSGQGSLYVGARDVNGRPTGLLPIGNVPSLELSIEITKFEHKESETGQRAVDLTLIQELNGTFNMTLESISQQNLELAFFGSTVTATGAAITNEVVTIYPAVDGVYPRTTLRHVKLNSAVPAVLTDSLSATMAIGTDYQIDYDLGEIWALAGWSGATLPDVGAIDYTYLTHKRFQAFTTTVVEKYLRFDGINTVDNERVILDIFKARFDPAQAFPLINDEVSQLSLTGTMVSDPLNFATYGSNFFVERRTA